MVFCHIFLCLNYWQYTWRNFNARLKTCITVDCSLLTHGASYSMKAMEEVMEAHGWVKHAPKLNCRWGTHHTKVARRDMPPACPSFFFPFSPALSLAGCALQHSVIGRKGNAMRPLCRCKSARLEHDNFVAGEAACGLCAAGLHCGVCTRPARDNTHRQPCGWRLAQGAGRLGAGLPTEGASPVSLTFQPAVRPCTLVRAPGHCDLMVMCTPH